MKQAGSLAFPRFPGSEELAFGLSVDLGACCYAILDSLDEIVFRTDIKGRWTYLNRAWEEATGFRAEDVLGRSFLEFTHPNDRPRAGKAFESLINRRVDRLKREIRYPVAEDGFRWAEVSVRVMLGADGRVLGTCGTLSHTTAHHAARAALPERECILRAILDHAPIGIWMQNREGRLLFVNRAFCDSVNIPEARFLEVPYYGVLLDEETGRNCKASDQVALERDAPSSSFEQIRFADGQLHDVEIVKIRLKSASGSTEGLVGLSSDVTERRRAEQALRASEERYRALYDETPSMFFTLDTGGTVLSVNDFGAGQLGYTPPELVGRSVMEIFLPEDHALVTQQLAECRARLGQVHGWQIRKQRKDGSILWVRETARVVLREGRPEILVVCQDITATVLACREQENLTAQLHQSQKLEALGTLASGIAHDFNNFLHIIIASADLSIEDVGPEHPSLESLMNIRKAGWRARDLVKQILTFSRPGHLKRQPVALGGVVDEAVQMLRVNLPASVEISTGSQDAPVDPVWISADPTQLLQVLLNLGTNGCHALDDCPGRIEIRHDLIQVEHPGPHPVRLSPGSYARLAVHDSGKGMSSAICERIFEPFFTTKALGKGTGLGLSIVHSIVQMHDGAIKVDSREGSGTTFTLYFPTCDPPVPPVSSMSQDPGSYPGQCG